MSEDDPICVHLFQVKNLRSGVSRAAVCTLGDLFSHLHKAMDQELEGTVKALLHKAGETSAFIRQDVDTALDCMVQHCTPSRSINALLSGGLRSVTMFGLQTCFPFIWHTSFLKCINALYLDFGCH